MCCTRIVIKYLKIIMVTRLIIRIAFRQLVIE